MNKKAISPELLAIVLLIVGLAIAIVFFIYLATNGKTFLTNLGNLSVNYTR